MDAQRWGSALPSHRHVACDNESETRKSISGVYYDQLRAPLAPTAMCCEGREQDNNLSGETNFLRDESVGIYFVSDMVSRYTPGVESAIISATECAHKIVDTIRGT